MKIFYWLITVPVILLCVFFAVSNRQDVTVDLWPLDYIMTSPLYVMTLGAFFCGFLFGALMFWVSSLRHRWERHRLSREVAKLKTQLEAEKSKNVVPQAPAPAADTTAMPPIP